MHHAESQSIYRVAALREIEARFSGESPPLMERAGAAATRAVLAHSRGARLAPLIVCGPGNNGGDGFVVARILRSRGINPTVVFTGDETKLPADAREAFDSLRSFGGEISHEIPKKPFSLVVDALFGIGLQRPVEGTYAELISRINAMDCPVLSLDIASGLCADTGRVLGCAVRAHFTATFIALKPGLLTLDGPDHSGEVSVYDLDIAPESVLPAEGRVVTTALFRDCLKRRPRNSHKGMMGGVGILGGAPGMTGAALLAGRAALKLGAGRVYVGLLDNAALAIDTDQPELMLRTPADVLSSGFATVLAAGPGLGQGADALELLRQAIAAELPLVLDADALNLLAAHPVLAGRVARRNAPTLLTPHPLEAARLLGIDIAEVRADRIGAALALAERMNAPTVLKGCGSVIASPAGHWYINTSGNPGMASAGMGDVLAGIAAALLAQGWPAEAALACATHLHGVAADRLVDAGVGPIGLTAGETIESARRAFNAWIYG
ncbi:MAG: NAD(P)H-hydrate dehydratase [Betaproteobacteria bacterium]|nr:NAD(P)H-hydrate dehydratase [Betaproteobacteria bacterium]